MPTLGDFYQEKILSQKDLIDREFPAILARSKSSRICLAANLFYGKKDILECRSEDEARYSESVDGIRGEGNFCASR